MTRKQLPSPAMIVACLSLVVAIGGTAYAASKINGKDIRKDSITGKQIKERTVKKVASAKKATKARTASTANSAQRIAGQNVDDLKVRWLLLDEGGRIEEQSGGFSVIDAYGADANVYIDAGEDTLGHGLLATIAINNRLDTYAPSGPDPNFAGQVGIGRCQTNSIECASAGAKNATSFVVSPRNADGSATTSSSRKRVYVLFTE